MENSRYNDNVSKIRPAWLFISQVVDTTNRKENLDIVLMDYLSETAKGSYLCRRPPGAAGALIRTQDYIIQTGVAPAPKSPTCIDVDCEIEYSASDVNHKLSTAKFHPHCVRTIHAERRAIHLAARFGIALEGSTIYSLLKPCYECSKAIIMAGITKIYYAGAAYDEERTKQILLDNGVTCARMPGIKLDYA